MKFSERELQDTSGEAGCIRQQEFAQTYGLKQTPKIKKTKFFLSAERMFWNRASRFDD
jgi:hypothetical protein